MHILTMEEKHRPQVVELMAQLQNHERLIASDRADGNAIADGHLTYLEACCDKHDGRVMVALEGDVVAGFVVCFVDSLAEDDLHVVEEHKKFGVITDLYVRQSYRSRGIAGALVKNAEKHLSRIGVRNIQIMTLPGNKPALGMYAHLGYSEYQVVLRKQV